MTFSRVHVERSAAHRLFDDAAVYMGETLYWFPGVDHQASQVIRGATLCN